MKKEDMFTVSDLIDRLTELKDKGYGDHPIFICVDPNGSKIHEMLRMGPCTMKTKDFTEEVIIIGDYEGLFEEKKEIVK